MNFLNRLFGTGPDPREGLQPLWHAIIGEARAPQWYRDCGAADTVEGRFDMIASITALVMLRMEQIGGDMLLASARVTELFAEDMEAQMRETGLGDPTLGKRMSKLMAGLNGRIGAFRTALADGETAVAQVVDRNARLRDGETPEPMAQRLMAFAQNLQNMTKDDLLAGRLKP